MVHLARGFSDVKVGDNFSSAMTMTETHIVMGAGLFGDFNPLHTNQRFAETSRFGGRIAHGYLTSASIAASLGMVFYGTAVAYLEHTCRFLAPVRAGDTLQTTWTVRETHPKPHHSGGIVVMDAVCINHHGERVAEATGTMLVGEALPS